MRLKTGDQAIPFSADTIDGKTISLAEFAGKPLLLRFYRYASCPMCNLRIRDFAQHYPQLHARGLEVVAVFHSPARNIRTHAQVVEKVMQASTAGEPSTPREACWLQPRVGLCMRHRGSIKNVSTVSPHHY